MCTCMCDFLYIKFETWKACMMLDWYCSWTTESKYNDFPLLAPVYTWFVNTRLCSPSTEPWLSMQIWNLHSKSEDRFVPRQARWLTQELAVLLVHVERPGTWLGVLRWQNHSLQGQLYARVHCHDYDGILTCFNYSSSITSRSGLQGHSTSTKAAVSQKAKI